MHLRSRLTARRLAAAGPAAARLRRLLRRPGPAGSRLGQARRPERRLRPAARHRHRLATTASTSSISPPASRSTTATATISASPGPRPTTATAGPAASASTATATSSSATRTTTASASIRRRARSCASIGGVGGTEPGQLGYVSDVVQDADGYYYVAEFGENQRITKFDPDGKFVNCWGAEGSEPGQFSRVRALALGPKTATSTWPTPATTASRCSPATASWSAAGANRATGRDR